MSAEPADLYFGRDDAELDIAEGGLQRARFLPIRVQRGAEGAETSHHRPEGLSAICRTLAAEEIRRFELLGRAPHRPGDQSACVTGRRRGPALG